MINSIRMHVSYDHEYLVSPSAGYMAGCPASTGRVMVVEGAPTSGTGPLNSNSEKSTSSSFRLCSVSPNKAGFQPIVDAVSDLWRVSKDVEVER